MLILSRSPGQTLMIGDEIAVTVMAVSEEQIKLGIEAPRAWAVHRQEVYNRIAAGVAKPTRQTGPRVQYRGRQA